MVDNWHSKQQQVINIQQQLATLPSNTLPAGYQIIMTLLNDAADNIIGATYVLIDNHGHTAGNQTIRFDNHPAQDWRPSSPSSSISWATSTAPPPCSRRARAR